MISGIVTSSRPTSSADALAGRSHEARSAETPDSAACAQTPANEVDTPAPGRPITAVNVPGTVDSRSGQTGTTSASYRRRPPGHRQTVSGTCDTADGSEPAHGSSVRHQPRRTRHGRGHWHDHRAGRAPGTRPGVDGADQAVGGARTAGAASRAGRVA